MIIIYNQLVTNFDVTVEKWNHLEIDYRFYFFDQQIVILFLYTKLVVIISFIV